jgi:dynein heavy chain
MIHYDEHVIYVCQGTRDSFINHGNEWKLIYDSKEPQNMKFPEPFDNLTEFQRILILRSLRPDRVFPAVQIFVECEQ